MADTENILRSHIHLDHYGQYTSFGQMIDMCLDRMNGDDVCLIEASSDEQLTVAELKTRANSIAVALIERGIEKTDNFVFYGKNSIKHLVLRFATYLLGNTYIPLSPTYGKYEIEREVKNTGANIMFTTAEDLHEFNGLLNDNENTVKLVVIFYGNDDKYVTYEQLLEEGRDRTLERIPYFDVNAEDIGLLMPTSGTTGTPKLAMISNRYLINATIALADRFPLRGGTRVTHAALIPLTHISGTVGIVAEIMNGATVVTFSGRLDEELLLRAIEKHRINVMTDMTMAFSGQLSDEYDLSSLKYIMSSNTLYMMAPVVHKYGIKMFNSYNMTEYMPVTRGSFHCAPFTSDNPGQIAPATEAKVVDLITGERLGAGISGEICIRGDRLFSGYYNNTGATEEAFDGEGWYRTGDIGYYDHQQRLFITDRTKALISVSLGHTFQHISPVEVELYLMTHLSIEDVVAVGVSKRTGFQCLRAYVVLKDGHKSNEEDIKRFVSDTLPVIKQLTGGVVFVDRIHRLSFGKIDRNYYRDLVKDVIIN